MPGVNTCFGGACVNTLALGHHVNTGARQWTLGYEHALSKRTSLYALYTQISNDANAGYTFGVNGLGGGAATVGADPQGFALGMYHNF